jgi:hypothetical protein
VGVWWGLVWLEIKGGSTPAKQNLLLNTFLEPADQLKNIVGIALNGKRV